MNVTCNKNKTVIFENAEGKKIYSFETNGKRLTKTRKLDIMREHAPEATGLCIVVGWNNANARYGSFRSGHDFLYYKIIGGAFVYTHKRSLTN